MRIFSLCVKFKVIRVEKHPLGDRDIKYYPSRGYGIEKEEKLIGEEKKCNYRHLAKVLLELNGRTNNSGTEEPRRIQPLRKDKGFRPDAPRRVSPILQSLWTPQLLISSFAASLGLSFFFFPRDIQGFDISTEWKLGRQEKTKQRNNAIKHN